MSADLHIHASGKIPKEELEQYNKTYITSWKDGKDTYLDENDNELFYDQEKIHNSESVWIGEVSWLKAGLMQDTDTFVPSTVMRVSEIVGRNLPVIDDEFIDKVIESFSLPNTTQYTLADKEEVREFLEKHKGEMAFQISW